MKYRKKPEIFEATQWFKDGDHPRVEKYKRLRKDKCCVCGLSDEFHGIANDFLIVCPGAWVVEKGGKIAEVLTNDEFLQKYEPEG